MEDKQHEEWVEKKARELVHTSFLGATHPYIGKAETFIRTLLNEAPKPKVSKEDVEELRVDLLYLEGYEVSDKLEEWLKERGFEVEK